MSDVSSSFHVVLKPDVTFVAMPLARRLAPILSASPVDLAHRLRYGGGFLARGVTLDHAARVEAEARALGIDVLRISEDAPLERTCIRQVGSIEQRGDHMEACSGAEIETFSSDEIECVDLIAFGVLDTLHEFLERDPESKRARAERAKNPLAAEARRLAECLPSPFARQRAAFIAHRRTILPYLYVTLRGADSILRIEPSTIYPGLAARDTRGWLDGLLGLFQALHERLPPERVFPATRAFWRDADLSAILVDRSEEIENRLSWLTVLIRNNLWPPREQPRE